MKQVKCWKCERMMVRTTDNFHGFRINAWKCKRCGDIVYDEADIQPILRYHKLKSVKSASSKVGVLGNNKVLRIPKYIEQIYNITKGQKIEFELEPGSIKLRVRPAG